MPRRAQGSYTTAWDTILYFTDMECDSYPENAPSYPIMWCDWRPAGGTWRSPPPWGEHISIAPE